MPEWIYVLIALIVLYFIIIAALIIYFVKLFRRVIRNIRSAELSIIGEFETRLSGNTLDYVVDIVTSRIEPALQAK